MAKADETSAEVVKVCPSVEDLQWKPTESGTRFVCPVKECKAFVFSSQKGMFQHISAVHPEISIRQPVSKNLGKVLHYHCPQKGCQYNDIFDRWFATFEQLRYHFVNTHDEKRFSCSKCEKRFGWERDKERHERECGRKFACGVCAATYPSRQALLTHCARKQHPIPPQYEKPEKKKASPADSKAESQDSSRGTHLTKPKSGSPQSKLIVLSGTGGTSKSQLRPILPKGLMVLSPQLPLLSTQPNPTLSSDSAPILSTQCAIMQTDDVTGSPRLRHVSHSGVNTDTQAGVPAFGCAGRQVYTTDMATQVSVAAGTSSNSVLCHMGTQVCAPASSSSSRLPCYSSELCHMGTQVSGHVPAIATSTSGHGPQMANMSLQTCLHPWSEESKKVPDLLDIDGLDDINSEAVGSGSGSGTSLVPQVSSTAVQTYGRPYVSNMAVQATHQIPDFANTATQSVSNDVDVFDMSTQVSDVYAYPSFDHTETKQSDSTLDMQVMVGASFLQPGSIEAGTNIGTQASFPFITVNKDSSTNSVGTQMNLAGIPEESAMASTGIQTSLKLIPSRPKFGVIAQTQTSGDYILRSAMASASIPVMKSPGRKQRGRGRSPARKRTTISSEVQTSQRKRRRMKDAILSLSTKGRPGALDDFSIATQTQPLTDRHPTSDLGMSTGGTHGQQQNPTLSSSVVGEEESQMWDPFLSPPSPPPAVSTCHTGLQADIDDFLSTYTTEFGVQTQDDFLSNYTADFGVQTQDDFLTACTADFGVQTQESHVETSTADLGVQTASSLLGSLLEDLDCMADCESGTLSAADRISYNFVRDSETGTKTVNLSAEGKTSSIGTSPVDLNVSIQCDVGDFPVLPSNQETFPKLFDSFDSDLSFSDCGTGTEDFFTSTHTQTCAEGDRNTLFPSLMHESHSANSGEFLPDIFSETSKEVHSGESTDPDSPIMSLFLSAASQTCDSTPLPPTAKSSSSTDTGLSSVAASNMHTQTANDLLTFLMNNMETQTTEDIPQSNWSVADTQTQTLPHALSPSLASPSLSLSALDEDTLALVTAETQTSSQFSLDLDDGEDEFFDIADMQTQTSFDVYAA